MFQLNRRYKPFTALAALLLIATTLVYMQSSRPGPDVTERERVFPNNNIDWQTFAYVLYATDHHYLCNALMMFHSLHRYQSKADRLLLYPDYMTGSLSTPAVKGSDGWLLRMARDQYGVKLKAVEVQRKTGNFKTTPETYSSMADDAIRCRRSDVGG